MTFAPFAASHITLASSKIPRPDSDRQERTAERILQFLHYQPGVILADEVGMGKTFVALAVAASIIIDDPLTGPVIVMMPPSVRDKWPRDWEYFQGHCMRGRASKWINHAVINSGAEFLKELVREDDTGLINDNRNSSEQKTRPRILFMSYGALNSTLRDGLFKLAFIRRAFKYRSSLSEQRRAFPRFAGQILELKSRIENRDEDLLGSLLEKPVKDWLELIQRSHWKLADKYRDDPVPEPVSDVLEQMEGGEFKELADALEDLPIRRSSGIDEKIKKVRNALKSVIRNIWRTVLRSVKFESPLLILDEAHHLKNDKTRLADLFAPPSYDQEGGELALGGPLSDKFARMLFLTATPFQLGHRELISVLDRFDGISWGSERCPEKMTRFDFAEWRIHLRKVLDASQVAANELEREWGNMKPHNLCDANGKAISPDDWWSSIRESQNLSMKVVRLANDALSKARVAEKSLSRWVIRNRKLPTMSSDPNVARRINLPGTGIRDNQPSNEGLEIAGDALLPFLLAARAQAMLRDTEYECNSFAEGLASSYEAYRFTRTGRNDRDHELEEDQAAAESTRRSALPAEVKWYLDRIDGSLKTNDGGVTEHPKMLATTKRAVKLWGQGEKVLIFCHYRATGRALRESISRALRTEILQQAKSKLPENPDEQNADLFRRTARHLEDSGSLGPAVQQFLNDQVIANSPTMSELERRRVVSVLRRFLRAPSFLVRHANLVAIDRPDDFVAALSVSMPYRIKGLCTFLTNRKGGLELNDYLEALEKCQPGNQIKLDDDDLEYDEAEAQSKEGHSTRLANVRLVNGESSRDMKRRLMLTFNSPLFPEILIASRVLAEGVDLHLQCRHVIHHDLDWNPSLLEQRTGRLDRIGSYSEEVRQPIHVYLPFVAGTQDEKMYRVVMERARWFEIVMGEKYQRSFLEVERSAERVPLPIELAKDLAMKLDNSQMR